MRRRLGDNIVPIARKSSQAERHRCWPSDGRLVSAQVTGGGYEKATIVGRTMFPKTICRSPNPPAPASVAY